MIILFPIVLVAAFVIARRRASTSRGGPRWFAAWAAAGALMTFSLLAGFSIGIYVLPLAAVVTLWVASRAPGTGDAIGFVAGVGLTAVAIGLVNEIVWAVVGLAIVLVAVAAYAAVPSQQRQLRS
jgi:hypothetical protein